MKNKESLFVSFLEIIFPSIPTRSYLRPNLQLYLLTAYFQCCGVSGVGRRLCHVIMAEFMKEAANVILALLSCLPMGLVPTDALLDYGKPGDT